MQKAIVEWDEYIEAQKDTAGEFIQQTTISNKGEKWRPPTRGTIKINSDTAFSQNMERTSIGVVTRNAEGELMKVWARAELKHSEPQVEEAVAIRMGMQMA